MGYIKRDRVLETLGKIKESQTGEGVWQDGWRQAVDNAIAAVKAMGPDMQWVSVEEELPDVDKYPEEYFESVNALAYSYGKVIRIRRERQRIAGNDERHWRTVNGFKRTGSGITHWMALPEPPEENCE